MIINHNISAMNAHRNLSINTEYGNKDMEKLSSGMRINRGADDAAGLAVSEKMRSQVRGLSMARRNAQDGVSLVQTAEGYLSETTSALQRVRELSVQAANDTYTDEDRKRIQTEVTQLVKEIDRIAEQAEFNTLKVLSGQFMSESQALDQSQPAGNAGVAPTPEQFAANGQGIRIQVGANYNQSVSFTIGKMDSTALGLKGNADGYTVDVTSHVNANRTLSVVDAALGKVTEQRTDLGAVQNRLETAMRGIEIGVENLQAAESRIRDTDMAQQMIDFVKDNILTNAATSMLAQANLRPLA